MDQIKPKLVSVRVAAELRRGIMSGAIKPGQELYQDMIAQELGVSRMPVREALQILAGDGLITLRPNRVATVNRFSEKSLRELCDVRLLLETAAIRMACANRPDCAEAWRGCEAAERAAAEGDASELAAQNSRFHRFIWQAADNERLRQYLRQLWNTVSLMPYPLEPAADSLREHREMLACIEQNDPDGAELTMRQHIKRSHARMAESFLKAGSTGE